MKLTGLEKTNAKRDTSSAVLNVHILQVKIKVNITVRNVTKPLGYTVLQFWNKHNIHRITIVLKPNVTLLQCSVHLFQYLCFWVPTVYILISCKIRVGSVTNTVIQTDEWVILRKLWAISADIWFSSVALLNLYNYSLEIQTLVWITHSLGFSLVWNKTKAIYNNRKKTAWNCSHFLKNFNVKWFETIICLATAQNI